MKVHFSVVEEFLAELEAEQNHVEDSIVRLTHQYEQSGTAAFIYHISVIAGFVVRGKLVYLKQFCGDIWQGEHVDKGDRAKEKAGQITAQIETKAEQLNLYTRQGMFEL